MVGKGTLLVMLGFSLIFGLASRYWERTSDEGVSNFVQYYDQSVAHTIAVSGANLGANEVYLDSTGAASLASLSGSLDGGSYTVTNTSLGQYKDSLVSVGSYEGVNDTVMVRFGPQYFSIFGMYTSTMNNVAWATGDTVWGRFHTNGSFNVMGDPVFYGRVTSLGAYHQYTPGDTAVIYGSYQSGINIPMPNTGVSNVENAAGTGGFLLSNPSMGSPFDVYMTFNSNGTATYYTNLNPTPVTKSVDSLAPNGVLFVQNGNLHVHGTVAGQVDMGASGNSGLNYGSVYLDGSLVCNNDPQVDPNSTDVIGVVAQNNVTVKGDNDYKGVSPADPPVNPTIEAAIYAQDGSFQAYYQGTPNYGVGAAYLLKNLGAVNVYGSISNYQIGITSDPNIKYGYNAHYRFDSRFSNIAPPDFPLTGKFMILSWYE